MMDSLAPLPWLTIIKR